MKPQDSFLRLYEIIVRLRGPEGCAWDREQTPESLRSHLIEEAYETVEAITGDDVAHVREELGDVYLLVTMIGVIFEERGAFSVSESLEEIGEKLVRRHPHVFGESAATTSGEIIEQWDRIKVEQEGKGRKDDYLHGVGGSLPPLERACKLQKRAAKVGFDWPDFAGVVGKLHEEIDETKAEHDLYASGSHDVRALEDEIGDLLFSAVNVARHAGVDPGVALHRANQKFVERFGAIERGLRAAGKSLENASLDEMEAIWQSAKHR